MKKKLNLICLLIAVVMLLPSCAPNNVDVFTGDQTNAPEYYPPDVEIDSQSEENSQAESEAVETSRGDDAENPFVDVKENATSRVVATANTASYRHFCDLVGSGYTLNELKKCSYSFNSEEFLNFLSDPAKDNFGDGLFTNNVKISKCLWNNNYFLKITFGAGESTYAEKNNIVFYIDVSESMWDTKMLPMMINNMEMFAGVIGGDDIISVVTSAPENSILIDSVSGENSDTIIDVFKNMNAQSAANNHNFLEDAYKIAEKNYIEDGSNKVVLVSDGDISEKYGELAGEYAKKGIELTVIGLGAGNYKNEKLQKLASMGLGEYLYIDGEIRAKEFLMAGIFKNTENVAQNLVSNISFDESIVSKYRLIGYESKDGGEGVGQNQPQMINRGDIITLCYELEFANGAVPDKKKIADAEINYIPYGLEDKVSTQFEISFDKYIENDREMTLLMSCVQTLMLLRDSPYAKNIKLSDIYKQLEEPESEEYSKAGEFTSLLGIITGKIKK